MPNDYYQILQVQPQASSEEIHRAYRALALRYHPDRNPTAEASATMTAINEAYSVLADPSRRRSYDQERCGEGSFDIAGADSIECEGNAASAGMDCFTRRRGEHDSREGCSCRACECCGSSGQRVVEEGGAAICGVHGGPGAGD